MPENQEAKKAALSLLLASTKLLDKIGQKRRRGLGQCDCSVRGLDKALFKDIDDAIDYLAGQEEAPLIVDADVEQENSLSESNGNVTGPGWTEFKISLEVLSPVVIGEACPWKYCDGA